MDPDQTAHTEAVCSGPKLFFIEASETFQQATKQMTVIVILTH